MWQAAVIVTGFRDRELDVLRVTHLPVEEWLRLLKVTVAGHDEIAVAGRYTVSDTAVEFRPLFPFDAGRSYKVRFDPGRIPGRSTTASDTVLNAVIAIPPKRRTSSTTVLRILPTSDVLPENQLRFYIEFSGSMSREGPLRFIKLLDENHHVVPNAFLPLDVDLWNRDQTRYTLFFDPGRVKRGILLNEELGRAIHVGHRYSIEIDARWRDSEGQQLVAPFHHSFSVGPSAESPIVISAWKVRAPREGTRATLVVTFPKPLDYGLLTRALSITTPDGRLLKGDVSIERAETEWRFTPHAPWQAGAHQLVVLPILEDPAGNRIGRAFEVDMHQGAGADIIQKKYMLPFTIQ